MNKFKSAFAFFLSLFLCVVFVAASCASFQTVNVEAQAEEEFLQEDAQENLEDEIFVQQFLQDEKLPFPVSPFPEIWAYVLKDNERTLQRGMHITDIAYFAAEVNFAGELVGIPNINTLPAFQARRHLVIICHSSSINHFVLRENSTDRSNLIRDIIRAAQAYEGLQINFENVSSRDAAVFASFLRELRAALPGKIFSVAIPARTRTLQTDAYDYARISAIVDRVLVMAYDEHWSTSAPGPVASLEWGKRVAEYALSTIGSDKLIMGVPLYGRSWSSPNHARAYFYSGAVRVMEENNAQDLRRVNGIPTFTYQAPVNVTVYFDDVYSLSARMEIYRNMGTRAIGFWRLGMEPTQLWSILEVQR